MSVTRRHFLMQLAATSGYTAAHAAMTTLGLGAVGVAVAAAAPVLPPPGSGKGRRVLVLGAGIAGLVSARELRKAGCQVRIVEARATERCATARASGTRTVAARLPASTRASISMRARRACPATTTPAAAAAANPAWRWKRKSIPATAPISCPMRQSTGRRGGGHLAPPRHPPGLAADRPLGPPV